MRAGSQLAASFGAKVLSGPEQPGAARPLTIQHQMRLGNDRMITTIANRTTVTRLSCTRGLAPVLLLRPPASPYSALQRPYSTPSSARPATISTQPIPTSPDKSYLPPQPFIPRPLLRIPQIKSLSKASIPHSTTIHFSNSTEITLPNLFLRDSSIHNQHVHPSSQQKLFRTTDIPLEGELVGFGVQDVGGEDVLVLEWSTAVAGVNERSAKLSVVRVEVLLELLDKGRKEKKTEGQLPPLITWDEQRLASTIQPFSFDSFMKSSATLHSTLTDLISTGIVFLKDVPTEKKEGHATTLRDLVERIGRLRSTWYGDLWDVKAEEGSKNIAYTNLDLGLHMDLIHLEHPPRYQFLHSLLNSQIVGGSSFFVDSYHLATLLRSSSPSHFHTLATTPMLFSYKNGDKWTRYVRPTIEMDSTGEIKAVNYSPPFQGPLPIASTTPELYEALKAFSEMMEVEENVYRTQLQPGDCVVFDNRRVLHARTAFEFAKGKEGAEGGQRGRWLKGAYMDGDEVYSTWRVLEEVRNKKK